MEPIDPDRGIKLKPAYLACIVGAVFALGLYMANIEAKVSEVAIMKRDICEIKYYMIYQIRPDKANCD